MSRGADERAHDVRRWLDAARAVHAQRAQHAASIAATTGLSPEGVEFGFDSLERDATPDELRALVASAGNAKHVHVILSANVFVAPLRAIALARAASERVTVRPSLRDPVLANALVAAAGDPAVSIATGRDVSALDADRIDVYGRDETIAQVRSQARPGVVVRGHGAGLGIALVACGRREPLAGGTGERVGVQAGPIAAVAAALASDVVAFDQRGCLSPRAAFVVGSPEDAEAFASALHDALSLLGSRIPRGSMAPEERSEGARWRDTLAFAGRVWGGPHHVVGLAASGMALALPPSGRHVLVVPVDSIAGAGDLVAPIAPFIVTVGSESPEHLVALGVPHARHAPIGRMQRPPLDGPADRRAP